MDEYRKLLILQYLDMAKRNYSIQKIFAKLGLEMEIGNQLLDELFNEQLIEYEDCLITITEKGRKILRQAPNNYLKIEDGNIFIHDISLDKRLSKNDIYIPKNF